jgi:hypothetical protein
VCLSNHSKRKEEANLKIIFQALNATENKTAVIQKRIVMMKLSMKMQIRYPSRKYRDKSIDFIQIFLI